jgi:hypothetical protein
MMSLKSMERGYCCLTELETKGLFSTCQEFTMYVGESFDVNDKNLQKSISAMVHSFILKILPHKC